MGEIRNGFEEGKNLPAFDTRDMTELQLLSTSKGNQRKWYFPKKDIYVKEQFFYQGKYWKDYLVEVVSSEIGKQLPAKCVKVLEQWECAIIDYTGKFHGVYSDNFAAGLSYIPFKRIMDSHNSYFDERAGIDEKWDFVLESIKKNCKLDYTDFLITMTIMDYLVGNEDRHLNNFGVLYGHGKFSMSPLFDFGLGLFEHDLKYEHIPFRKCLTLMYSKPFHIDNQKVIDYLAKRYHIGEYVPRHLDLSGVKIPSSKAGSYLRNRCSLLGIHLEGVE
ncbi:hypothetical protein D7V82_04865 [bacterium 1xD8-6]|nr:hypothetical protein D7V72_05550 [bacterium D16-36]RKI71988.1 hypothetical protein D7V82_04865 [bacterium 1xD8-6]